MNEQAGKQVPSSDDGDLSLDEIIAELDAEYTGTIPKQALRAAQRRRGEITPRLIELIRKATESVRAGNEVTSNGHLFALYLLTEFEAKEALPAIIDALSLPGEGPFDLFGDALTEDVANVLVTLTDNRLEVVDELIANRALNMFVRWEGIQTYLYWVRDGRLTREQAVQRLRELLWDAITNNDVEGATGLVAELYSFAPREALGEIKEAYRRGLVDESVVTLKNIERTIADGELHFEEQLRCCPRTGVRDTVAQLSNWASFREDRPLEEAFEDEWTADLEYGDPPAPSTSIWNISPKVGRNEPCPCGSGKKFKKCCGAK